MTLQTSFWFMLTILFISCSDNSKRHPQPNSHTVKTLYQNKPAATNSDTLIINSIAAVFYGPDSLQLQKISSIAEPVVFESKMHEYEYLAKTAKSIIIKKFPLIQIIEAKSVRYLLFIELDKKVSCIDLDRNYDPYGLYVFDHRKAPQLVDMSNTETDLGFYFSK